MNAMLYHTIYVNILLVHGYATYYSSTKVILWTDENSI